MSTPPEHESPASRYDQSVSEPDPAEGRGPVAPASPAGRYDQYASEPGPAEGRGPAAPAPPAGRYDQSASEPDPAEGQWPAAPAPPAGRRARSRRRRGAAAREERSPAELADQVSLPWQEPLVSCGESDEAQPHPASRFEEGDWERELPVCHFEDLDTDRDLPTELPEPRVVPRSQHTISRRHIDPEAVKVLYRLHNHGFRAYLVGGGVRDLLLGKRPKDFDVGTDAHPGQVKALFKNSRVIGKRFRLVQVFFRGGKLVEVSTFRRAADPDDEAVLSANNTFGSPAEDALRRDLTINALFYNIADYSVVDYVGGLDDLKAGLIRAVGDPEVRFRRDPVRMLRAVRHAARAGFTLTPDTREAIEHHRAELGLCPQSRLRDEIIRDLAGGAAAAWLELAHLTGVLYSLFPLLEPLFGPDASPARLRARELLTGVDAMLARGESPEEAVLAGALLWPALEELARRRELPGGRPGRAAFLRLLAEQLVALAQPVGFPRRVMERLRQIGGVLAILRDPQDAPRLPRKIAAKGYFPAARQLAALLGYDLLAETEEEAPRLAPAKRRRPRRPRRHKRSAAASVAPPA